MRILLLLLFPIALQAQLYFPPKTGTAWATEDPAVLGFCPDRIDSLYAFLENNNTKSFILLHDGKIVLEKYFGTYVQDSIWYWASAGKSASAFLVGQAQEAGLIDIHQPTSTYLGVGWTSLSPDKEQLITPWHQLSMTSGLDDGTGDANCTDPACLIYKADAGTRWAYHNGVYHLLHDVIEEASGQTLNIFTKQRLLDPTGMKGLWFDHILYGRARDMARYGLLNLAGGIWDGDTLLHDQDYFQAMSQPSQNINPAYGYLWWLNGQDTFMLPGLQLRIPGKLIPNAPDDMYSALGKNDQKIHIVPSKGWVVVRQGDASNFMTPGGGTVPIVFDNALWEKLNALECGSVAVDEVETPEVQVWPNPSNSGWTVKLPEGTERLELWDAMGRKVWEQNGVTAGDFLVPGNNLKAGMYRLVMIDAMRQRRTVSLYKIL
ncbi:MAG: serine hydrolase [Saprospiraceae bacterium]|nr:serine hydrolase [Saprospiraceae bacterium]